MENLETIVAASLDADEELYPFLPELFRDLDEIGVRTCHVLEILQQAQIKQGDHVLDLGCGKGAIARAIAESFGATVHGYDAVEAFVEDAQRHPTSKGSCHFDVMDIRKLDKQPEDFALVCLLAMGDIMGQLPDAIYRLRQQVAPGGYILIDDAFIPEPENYDPSYFENCYGHAATVERLTQHGDELIAEKQIDGAVQRAQALALSNPQMADAIVEYAERQSQELALMDGPVVGALWLLRRGY